MDTNGVLFKGTNSFIIISQPYSLYYLLALLNSRLLDKYYEKLGKGYHGGSRKYEPGKIDHFPVYKITFSSNREFLLEHASHFNNIYSNILSTLDSHTNSDYSLDYLPLLSITNNILSLDEGHNDIVHEFLAFLAEQMSFKKKQLNLNKSKFLGWLAQEIGVDINNLASKTQLQNYSGDYTNKESHLGFEQLLDILRKNKNILSTDLEERAFRKTLERNYHESLDLLKNLNKHLSITDKIIDQIVYRLYGLNDDEIAIMEEKA